MRRASIDLSELARTIAEELLEREPGRRVDFEIADGAVVVGDPELLRVVLVNLLENAWKFTAGRPSARIEVGVADGTFFVRDDGVGFDMAYAEKLFGAFQRLHASSEFPGNGIGLATVRRIVDRHGGRVWAEAAPDAGATFFFTLGGDPTARSESGSALALG